MVRNIVLGLIILLIASGVALFSFQAQIKKHFIPIIIKSIKDETLVNIEFQDVECDLTKLLKLQPTIIITEMKIENTLNFHTISLELYLKSLFNKKLLIKKIIIDQANLILDTNARQELVPHGLDLKKITAHIEERNKNRKNKNQATFLETIKLNELKILNSSLDIYPYNSHKAIKLSDINLSLFDFVISNKEQIIAQLELDAKFFGSDRSRLKANARLGPINLKFSSLPITGKHHINLFIKDIPQELKEKQLGKQIISTNRAQIRVNGEFKGDLLNNISSLGQLELLDLMIGNSPEHSLTLKSLMPISTSQNLVHPSINLSINNGLLEIFSKDSNKGTLNINANIHQNLITQYTSGSASGKLEGLEMEEVLNCLTPHRKLLSGTFEIKNLQLAFAGTGANQISKSLSGAGHITIKNGSLYILKSLTRFKDIASILVNGGGAFVEKLSGSFISLDNDFILKGGDLILNGINIDTTGVNIQGSGTIFSNQRLAFSTDLHFGKVTPPIYILIDGTINKPRIKPDLKRIGQAELDNVKQIGVDIVKQASTQIQSLSKQEIQKIQELGKTQIDKIKTMDKDQKDKLVRGIFNQLNTVLKPPAQGQGLGTNGSI